MSDQLIPVSDQLIPVSDQLIPVSLQGAARGRGFRRQQDQHTEPLGDDRDVRWRSMSADRATRPLLVHTDVIVPAQVWQFSETAV